MNEDKHYIKSYSFLAQAPETGDYTFFISSDDDSEFWISTDASKANARKILTMFRKVTNQYQWDKYVFHILKGNCHEQFNLKKTA